MIEGKRVGVIVPAAGAGRRMGSALPKALIPLGGTPILVHTLRKFQYQPEVDDIVVVVRAGDHLDVEKALSGEGLTKVRAIVPGGEERQDSVRIGLAALLPREVGIVLIHDAVRPFVESGTISAVARGAFQHGAAVAGVRAKDTVRIARPAGGSETPERKNCWLVQTPQGFRTDLFARAMERATADRFYGTDDAGLVERLGEKVVIVGGSYRNIKITDPEDLEWGALLLESGESGHRSP